MTFTRRRLLAAAAGVAALPAAPAPMAIETHVHLFDPKRVPYSPAAPYQPVAYPLEEHLKLVREAGLAHSVIVHPEPYQDDHRYLEYCFSHEPSAGYFKGVCLFDAFRQDTPSRLRALMERWPGRIVAVRIHAVSITPEADGPIRNRDLADPRMVAFWQSLTSLKLAVQMHFIPGQASRLYALASRFPETTVILDHMGRPGNGTDEEYREVLSLAKLPRVIMKYSGWDMYKGDLNVLTHRIYDAFGPARMVWGMLGNTAGDYHKQSARFDELLSFLPQAERTRIRGTNAQELFFAGPPARG